MFATSVNKTLHCGTFDAENFWRDKNISKLPAVNDNGANNIVLAMDELLFPFCKAGDVLVTRFKMNEAHRDYLKDLGFSFDNNKLDIEKKGIEEKTIKNKSVFELLADTEDVEYFKKIIPNNIEISPFAVIPYIEEISKLYNIKLDSPQADIVKDLNSKVYSTALRDRLGIKNIGNVVSDYSQMSVVGNKLLQNGPFILKDSYGVSGKGNILVENEDIFDRILQYMKLQESQGKTILIVIEPFLKKQSDFSCQFYIDKKGIVSIISVQRLINSDFAYKGSCTAEDEFLKYLENQGYFLLMHRVGTEMFKDGYYGHVCIDSMVLENMQIEPIVEINARKSMSLIKHYMDKHMATFSVQGNMTYFSIGGDRIIEFDEVLENMDRNGILFKPGLCNGIVPMSPNSMLVNRSNEKTYKGRLYSYIVAKGMEEREVISQKMRELLSSMGLNVYN